MKISANQCEICRINESEIENTLYDVSVWSCQHCIDTRPGDIWEKISLKHERCLTTRLPDKELKNES